MKIWLYIALGIAFVVIVLLGYDRWQLSTSNDRLSSDVITALNEKNAVNRELNDIHQELSNTNSLVLSQSKEISEQASEIDRLQLLKSQTKVEFITIREPFEVPIIDTVYVDGADTIQYKIASYEDSWLSFHARVLPAKVIIDTLSMINKFTLEIGYEKTGMFKKPVAKAYLFNENPYTTTNTITSIQFEEEKKWHQRPIFWLFIGIGGGMILMK